MSELDNFGKLVMDKVRDPSINQLYTVIDRAKNGDGSPYAVMIRELMASEDPEKNIAKLAVDMAIAYFLGAFEESNEFTVVNLNNGKYISFVENSDGLEGELYGDDGWVEKYSRYPG